MVEIPILIFAVIGDRAPVQKMSSLATAPKPRLFFLTTLTQLGANL